MPALSLALEPIPSASSRRLAADALTQRLRRKYADRITGHFVLPGSEGRYAPLPPELPPALSAALRARGIERLYSHQAEAFAAAQAGRHVVVVTPTASGKSLCYTLPITMAAITQQAKALYLFPTKALAQDQVSELLELNRAGARGLRTFTFDGDTPGDARQAIRVHDQIVVTNPDMLHRGILPHHPKWAPLFENLRHVVIDAVHTHRGVFGAHVANVTRRIKRVCAFYGASPQFILCSATVGNPQAHAQALIEHAVHAITASGAPAQRAPHPAMESAGGESRSRPARLGALAVQPHRPHCHPCRPQDPGVRAVTRARAYRRRPTADRARSDPLHRLRVAVPRRRAFWPVRT